MKDNSIQKKARLSIAKKMGKTRTSGKNPGAGRPRGSKNKITQNIRVMILDSLDRRGGVKWLNGLADPEFARLLARVIPQETTEHHEGNITVEIIANGNGK